MAGAPDVKNSFFPKLLKCLANLTTFLSVSHSPPPNQLSSHACLSQEPIPTVEGFLPILLESWDGEDYQADVLALLSHLSLQPFEGTVKSAYSVCLTEASCLFQSWRRVISLH